MRAISVIVPSHNRSAFLMKAIESILEQSFVDFEIIVVDDGSTDDTYHMLQRYPGTRVIRQKRLGVSAARNKGIKMSCAPLIAFLDSDDLWLPEKLAIQFNFFKANPDALICQTEEIWIRNGRRVNPKKHHRKPCGEIFEPSLKLCLVSPSAVMVRRCLLDEIGLFDENLPACEDYDLWLRVACRYPIHLIADPLVVKRGGHDDQLSKTAGLDRFRIQALINLLNREPLSNKQRMAAIQVLKEKCAIYANGCMKRGRFEEAASYLSLSSSIAAD